MDEASHRARQQAQSIADDILRPLAARTDAERRWPQEAFRALQHAGLAGLTVPAQWGGLGLAGSGLFSTCEVLGSACPSTAISFGMHCVGAAVIAANASDEQGERYLRPIAEGRHITSLALSESGTGSFFYFPQTRIQRESDTMYRVTGEKCFVTNGGHADSYVISGLEQTPDGGNEQFSCLVVDHDSPGTRWIGEWQGLGMRGNSSIQLAMDNTPVPASQRLGQIGDQIWYVFHVVAPYFLLAMSGTYIGLASRALELAIEHVRERDYAHSGTSLADAPIVQHRLGELWARVERCRQLGRAAASAFDAAEPDSLPQLLASKADAGECATQTVNDAMTLCGGAGFREGHELHRLLHDARAAHVMAPTTDLLRIWTGRALLEKSLLAP